MSINWEFPADYDRHSRDILETALGEVTAYRSWQAYDPGPAYPVGRRYAAMPALTKQDIRRHLPQGFVPAGSDFKKGLADGEIELVETSGMLGDRVTNIWHQPWWDASEKASWGLNSRAAKIATGNHPEAILVNPLNVGYASDAVDLPMEKRRLGRFLYLNEKTDTAAWTPGHMERMTRELGVFQPTVLEANPSLLAKLCRYIAAANKPVFQPQLIVLTYEYPSVFHYRQIRQVFEAPVASSYGTTETGYVFMQCEAGRFHQNSEFCRVDFQPLKPTYGGPLLSRMLVTTFNNPWYYIVRFDVGDLARLDEQGRCPCGRDAGFILSAIEGRVTNLTLTCRGRPVTLHELDKNLSVLDGIDEYRLEQAAEGVYRLYLVSRRRDKDRLSEEASAVLKGLYGQEAEVSLIYQDAILPESAGKYSLAKTLFPVDIGPYLDEGHITR